MSPNLFDIILESVFKQLNRDQEGVNIDGKYLNNLRFADDVVLVSDGLREMKVLLNILQEVCGSSETLTLTDATAKKLQLMQRRMARSMLGVTLRDHIRNEDEKEIA
ncbi:hypothetical protein Trydic_g8703 [Trypoxylus dichotomus]